MDSQMPSSQMPAAPKGGIANEFVYDPSRSGSPRRGMFKVGKSWASALTGFMAGVVVASIILIPWMFVLNQYCPSSSLK